MEGTTPVARPGSPSAILADYLHFLEDCYHNWKDNTTFCVLQFIWEKMSNNLEQITFLDLLLSENQQKVESSDSCANLW
jgi:hypothetical protein